MRAPDVVRRRVAACSHVRDAGPVARREAPLWLRDARVGMVAGGGGEGVGCGWRLAGDPLVGTLRCAAKEHGHAGRVEGAEAFGGGLDVVV